MPEWSLSEIITSAEAQPLAPGGPQRCADVFTDTRSPIKDGLFVPLSGENFDGHAYVSKALQLGAALALWAKSPQEVPADCPPERILLVKDSLAAYQALGRANLQRLSIPAVAVTGSVGKTTCKDLIKAILSRCYQVHCTPLNHNNEIGAAKTLLELTEADQIAVVEMGMRGRGQITQLAKLLCQKEAAKHFNYNEICLITTIGESHLELLGTRENIALAKAELLDEASPHSLAVLPYDCDFYPLLCQHSRGPHVSFSLSSQQADWYLSERQDVCRRQDGQLTMGQQLTIMSPHGKQEMFLALPGRHNAVNFLAALAVCDALGVPLAEAARAAEAFNSARQRLAFESLQGQVTLIDDSYNAAPASVEAALDILQAFPAPGRRLAVLGDMLELGTNTAEMHAEVGRYCAMHGVDLLIAVGPLSRKMAEAAREGSSVQVFSCDDRRQAWQLLQEHLQDGDTVLVKASHSIALDYTADCLRQARK